MSNIIFAAFENGATSCRTSPLYQYDYGQILRITGIELPTAYETHFSNEPHGTAVIQIGSGEGVTIPDSMLLSGQPVYAWIFLHAGADDGETEYVITIPVIGRAAITDDPPTPVEQRAIDQAIAALDLAVEKTGEDVETTAGFAESARQYAQDAETAREGAAEARNDAEDAKDNATLAKESAEAARTAAETARDTARTAQRSASESADFAESYAESADIAWNGAERAKNRAEAALAEFTNVTAVAETLAPGSQATANYQNGTLTFGIPQGIKGETGDTGPQGEKGETGPQGIQGPKGETGDRGATGPQGIQGEAGPKGESGVYYGTTAPIDPDINVWIDPNGTSDPDIEELKGDVDDLKSALDGVVSGVVSPYLGQNWIEGSIYPSTGGDNNESGFLTQNRRTAYLSNDVVGVNINPGFYFRIYAYQQDDTYVGVWNGSGYQKSVYNLTANLYFGNLFGGYKLRLVFGKVSGEAITDDEVTNIELLTYVNESLPPEIVNMQSLSSDISSNMVPGQYEEQVITWGAANQYINPNNGVISDAGATNVHVSDYIDVSEISYIRLTASPYYSFCCLAFYDGSKSFIRAYPSSSSNVNYWMEEIAVPENAKYAVFGNNSAISGKLDVKVEFVTSYSTFLTRKWIGKKWACVGDSLTEINDRASMRYMDYIQIATGIKPYNMGVSGTGYANGHANSKAFIDRIVNVPTDSDVVTIFGSNNDMFGDNLPVGDPTDTGTATLCGFINGTIDALYATFPQANLGIITPCPWENIYPAATTTLGQKGIAYSQALVDICKRRGIPCLDLFHCSGMRPWEESYRALYYTGDDGGGVHPDVNGHKILASHFKAFLETLLI